MTRDLKLQRAGDYVLGLLEGTDRQAFETEMRRDPELAGMADRLAARLHALDDSAGADPAPALWASIEQRIATVPQLPPPAANENPRQPVPRWAAVAAGVIIALGAGYFAGQGLAPAEPKPTMVAVLVNETDLSPGAIIEAFGDDTIHVVPLEDFAVPDGRVLEVWTLPNAETGPVSLGTLAEAADARLRGPELPAPAAGQLYEITLEPAPRSPTGRPTGPILVKGFAKAPI